MNRESYLFPRISEHDFPAFRDLLIEDAPDTYPGWLALMKRRRLVEMFHGYDVKEIDVNPGEYIRFCGERGRKPNLKSLDDFVSEVASGRKF